VKTGRAGLTLCSVLFLLTATEPAGARSLIVHRPEPPEAILLAPSADAQGDKRPTLMFVEYRQPAKFVGLPNICPGSSPEENQDGIVCMAELYEGPARGLRHLSGPKLPRNMRLRTTAHSMHVFLRPGSLLLVAAQPFVDQGTEGVFAHWWRMADDDGRFCFREDELAELGIEESWRQAKPSDGRDPADKVTHHRCLKP
jgi:hypothetical protein